MHRFVIYIDNGRNIASIGVLTSGLYGKKNQSLSVMFLNICLHIKSN